MDKDLRTRLLARAIYYPRNTTRFFIPDGVLDELLDEASANNKLPHPRHAVTVGADTTLESESTNQQIYEIRDGKLCFKKIFAILVLIEKVDAIQDFTESGIDDSRLPFFNKHGANGLFYATDEDEHTCLSFTWRWSWSVSVSFLGKQWAFLAPNFRSTPENICHSRLLEEHILPITHDEGPNIPRSERVLGETIRNLGRFGALSEVTKVRLHPRHFDFQDYPLYGFDGKVVLKNISASDEKQFEKERCALTTVARWRNKHIIPLLASFEVPRHGYYLVFPCAAGDLNSLWRSFPTIVKQGANLAWMLRECYGLTEALASIHQGPAPRSADKSDGVRMAVLLPYRHGDLTPSNIVWFPDGDNIRNTHLSIADFGESVLGNGSKLPGQGHDHRGIDFNWTYQAPESDSRNALELTSAVDIWMLGCVFAEFITWYLLGTTADVDQFAQARLEEDEKGGIRVTLDAFYTSIDGQFIVKPAVVRWLDMLSLSPGCTECVHDFIALVRDCMVVAIPGQRTQSGALAFKLKLLYRRCLEDEDEWHPSP